MQAARFSSDDSVSEWRIFISDNLQDKEKSLQKSLEIPILQVIGLWLNRGSRETKLKLQTAVYGDAIVRDSYPVT